MTYSFKNPYIKWGLYIVIGGIVYYLLYLWYKNYKKNLSLSQGGNISQRGMICFEHTEYGSHQVPCKDSSERMAVNKNPIVPITGSGIIAPEQTVFKFDYIYNVSSNQLYRYGVIGVPNFPDGYIAGYIGNGVGRKVTVSIGSKKIPATIESISSDRKSMTVNAGTYTGGNWTGGPMPSGEISGTVTI